MSTPQQITRPPGAPVPTARDPLFPAAGEIELIPSEHLIESKTNPRKYFDPVSLKELTESIRQDGIIKPLLIRPLPTGKLEIVDGARRFRAAKAAVRDILPAIVRKLTDDDVIAIQLISFLHEEHPHPLDEAEAYKRLVDRKFTVPQIAMSVGKDRVYVARRLQLINLIESGVKMMREEKLPLPHALEVARLGPDQQKQALDNFRSGPPSLKRLRDDIQQDILFNLDSAQFKKDDATLVPKAGPCTSCPKRTGANQDLFGDISKKGNHCLDGQCFHEKIQAFNDRRKEELEAKGIKVVEISGNYYPRNKKVLGTKAYHVVPASKANAYGRYIDGRQENVLVPIVIKGEKQAEGSGSTHQPKKLSREEAQRRYKRRCEIFENRIEQEARLHQFKSLLLRLKWPIERKDFDIIVLELMHRSKFDSERIAEAIGLKDLPDPGFEDKAEMKNLSKLTDQQVAQATLGIILHQELIDDPLEGIPEDDRFVALCSRHGIDRKKIRDEVAKGMAPKRPKPPKVEEPKKKPVTKSDKKSKPKAKSPAKKKSKK